MSVLRFESIALVVLSVVIGASTSAPSSSSSWHLRTASGPSADGFVKQDVDDETYDEIASSGSNTVEWPPSSIGNNVPSVYGLAPRAYFYAACTAVYCDVFGGESPAHVPTSDMFEAQLLPYPFSSSTSTSSSAYSYLKISPPGSPSPRSGGAMVMLYSDTLGEWVSFVFGGTTSDGTPDAGAFFYRYEVEAWVTASLPSNANQVVPPMTMFSMVSLGGENFTVFFGASSQKGILNTVFEGTLRAAESAVASFVLRTDVTPVNLNDGIPVPRLGACCVASPMNRTSMCFGGVTGLFPLNDTWIYHHDAATWTLVPPPPPPGGGVFISRRYNAMCAYLPSRNSALLYGGFVNGNRLPPRDSLIYEFSFNSSTWSALLSVSEIPPRGGGAMLVTNNGSSVEILGGEDDEGIFGDRWIINVSHRILPPPRSSSAVVHSSGGGGGGGDGGSPSTPTTTATAAVGSTSYPPPPPPPPQADVHLLEADNLVPDATQYQSSIQVGHGMLIAFGTGNALSNTAYYCNNMNRSTMSCTWLLVVIPTAAAVPSPRFGACATANGHAVYFFGGFTKQDMSAMSNELWTLTLHFSSINSVNITGTWSLITPSTASATGVGGQTVIPIQVPPMRAFHQCIFVNSLLFVVGGVVGSQTGYSGSIHTFDVQRQIWVEMTVQPPLQPRAGHSMHWNSTHAIVIGGVNEGTGGKVVLGDIVAISPTGIYNMLATTTIISDGPVQRAFAATAGSGNNILVCGGSLFASSQLTLGAPTDMQCIMITLGGIYANINFYAMTRRNSYGQLVEAAGIGGSAALIGEVFVYFGGSLVAFQVPREMTYYDATEAFDFTPLLCSQEALVAAAAAGGNAPPCWTCGAGTRNPTLAEMAQRISCVVTPAGYYLPFGATQPVPCPPGKCSNMLGASGIDSCTLCPVGSYANRSGMTKCTPCPKGYQCPLGAIAPQLGNQTVTTATQSQPPAMPDGATPFYLFGVAAGIVCMLLTILGVVSCFAHRARQKRKVYFLNEPALETLREAYDTNKTSHFGLDAHRLETVLLDIGVTYLPKGFAARILAENDNDGSGHVTFTCFQEIVIAFIEKGLLKPFPNTGEAFAPGRGLSGLERKFVQFNFKSLDSYDTQHALGVEGEAIRIHSTLSGGVTRLVFNVVAIGVVLALVAQFVYTNISETRGTTPSVNFVDPLYATSMVISVTAVGGVQTWSDCASQPSGVAKCQANNGATSLSPGGLLFNGDNLTQSCEYDASRLACTIIISCLDCALVYGEQVTLGLAFGWTTYAAELDVTIDITTGIQDTHSISEMIVAPSDPRLVFRGYPSTILTFPVLPTQVQTVNNIIQQTVVDSSGYHVLLGHADAGNVIDSSQVTEYFGVPIQIVFTVESNVLTVKQLPKATVVDFVSQMLGSVTGLGGILVTLMQLYDSYFISRRHEKLRAEMEEEALEGRARRPSRKPIGSTTHLQEAEEELLTVSHADGGAGGS